MFARFSDANPAVTSPIANTDNPQPPGDTAEQDQQAHTGHYTDVLYRLDLVSEVKMPAPIRTAGSKHLDGVAGRQRPATAERLAELIRAHRRPAAPALRKAEQSVWARLDTASPSRHAA